MMLPQVFDLIKDGASTSRVELVVIEVNSG